MNQLLIGLWGPAGVGKDSIADALGFPKASFAAALKSDVKPLADNLGLDLTKRADKEKLRPVLVEYGKAARAVDPNHWVKRLERPYEPVVSITDVRYWNEILSIVFRWGVVFEIVRKGIEPYNDEERRSFQEIRDNLNALGVFIPTIENTTPEEAAQQILLGLRERQCYLVNGKYTEVD